MYKYLKIFVSGGEKMKRTAITVNMLYWSLIYLSKTKLFKKNYIDIKNIVIAIIINAARVSTIVKTINHRNHIEN